MDTARPARVTSAPWSSGLSTEHSQEKVILQVDQSLDWLQGTVSIHSIHLIPRRTRLTVLEGSGSSSAATAQKLSCS